MERILITGATGFIGRHVVEELLQRGFFIRILTRNPRFVIKDYMDKVEIKVVDYQNIDTLKGIEKNIDYVLHMAGVIKGKTFEPFKKGNIYTITNLLRVFENSFVKKFVFLSSQSAAGPSSNEPLNEEVAPHPVSFYGLSKKIAEDRLIKSGLPYIILRPSAVFGEGDKETLAVFKMAKYGISLSSGTGPFFNIIYVKDLVRVLVNSIASNLENGIYFVNNGEVYNPRKLARLIGSVMGKEKVLHLNMPMVLSKMVVFLSEFYSDLSGKEIMLTREKLRELSQDKWIASNRKLIEKFGVTFTPTVKAMLATYRWYKGHGWL